MDDYFSLALGIISAGMGGELFVRGTVRLAAWARISPGIVAATVAAFATSSPELSVSVSSAIAGQPDIALGDALGSNVVNVALILGAALLIGGIQASRSGVRRDFPVALGVPVMTGALFVDGTLSRGDGVLMLGAFAVWLIATIVEARKERSAAHKVLGTRHAWSAAVYSVLGLAFLIVAGHLIVVGARGLASEFGVEEFVVGATLVAVGTSVPELATSIVAKLRGHDDVGLGTILGSNIFNGLFIIPLAAVIHPIFVPLRTLLLALMLGILALLCCFPPKTGFIRRRRGVALIVVYAIYLTVILQFPSSHSTAGE
jgi:cation:H+ antiporter